MQRHKWFVYDLVREFNTRSLRANWQLEISGGSHLNPLTIRQLIELHLPGNR